MLPVLDRNMQRVPMKIEIGTDRFDGPVAILVDDVPPITIREQLLVILRSFGPGQRMRPYTDGCIELTRAPVLGRKLFIHNASRPLAKPAH